jgi:hypothetical protein
MAEQLVEHWVEHVTTTDTWAQVVARAWADEAFQARLVADPTAVLREAGVAVPAGLEVRVQETTGVPEATAHGAHLVLPPKPPAGEIWEEQLTSVAGRGIRFTTSQTKPAPACGQICSCEF